MSRCWISTLWSWLVSQWPWPGTYLLINMYFFEVIDTYQTNNNCGSLLFVPDPLELKLCASCDITFFVWSLDQKRICILWAVLLCLPDPDPCFNKQKSKKNRDFYYFLSSSLTFYLWSRVVDPYSIFTDPDPDPELDVGCQYGSGSKSGSGSRALITKNWKKITAENFFYFFDQKLQFTFP